MAFSIGGFSRLKSQGRNSIYTYSTADTKAVVEGAAYFNNVAPFSLIEGDIIICAMDNDGTIGTANYVVTDKTSGVVTIAESKSGKVYLFGEITDISTGSSHWIVSPVAGTITKIYSVINGAIATADAALSFELAGVAVTGGGITIAYSGSAAGDADSATPTALNAVTAGQAIEMITNGASTNTIKAKITIEITLS